LKINRLFEIVYMLLSKKSITARELSEHFEVSTRTIYRDLDILTTAGIPVYANKGKSGGIMLTDNFVLNKSLLSKSEQNDILFALESMKAAKYPDVGSVLSKLNSFFNKQSENWIQIDFSSWGNFDREKFISLKNAILNKKTVKIEYYNTYGEKNCREIEPLQLWFKEKSWYLKAFCRYKNDLRLFKITRIKNLSVTEKTFKREIKNDPFTGVFAAKQPSEKYVKVIMKIDGAQAYRVYDEFDKKHIKKNKDGSFTVSMFFPADEWMYGYIMSFGQFCEVIKPKYLREIIKNRLKNALNKYL